MPRRAGVEVREVFDTLRGFVAGNDEGDLFDGIVFAQKCRCRIDRDFGGGGDRIAICATTDRWKCNRPEFVGHGELQRISITIRESLRFAASAARPNRADGVNDETRGKRIAARDLRFAEPAAAERFALGQQLRAGGPMNGVIDSAAA